MNLQDWNRFIRPSIWAFGLGVFLIGVLASHIFLFQHIIGAVIAILLCTASITLNHYYDYETDRKSKQLYRFPVASEKISRKFAISFSIAVMLLSIVLAISFLSTLVVGIVIFANFMIYSYSAPPFRIKERKYIETFWNGLAYGSIAYYLGILISNIPLTIYNHLLGIIPFLIAASGHILLQVRDIKDDKKAKVKTTSTNLGLKTMKRISGAFVILSGIIIIFLAIVGFLNYLAWLAIAAGVLVAIEHKRMKKDVTKSYLKLQLIYVIGGILFILSIIKF